MNDEWMMLNFILENYFFDFGNDLGNMIDWLMDFYFKVFDFEVLNFFRDKGWRIFMIILFGVVIFFGFIENLMVIIVIIINKRFYIVINVFILILLFSDIMFCVFNLLF